MFLQHKKTDCKYAKYSHNQGFNSLAFKWWKKWNTSIVNRTSSSIILWNRASALFLFSRESF